MLLRSALVWVTDKLNQSSAVALVFVSERFLGSHPYLKDSAALVRVADAAQAESDGRVRQGFQEVCQMSTNPNCRLDEFLLTPHPVWDLRGWSHTQDVAGRDERLCRQGESGQSFELSRADAKSIPKWSDVEHKHDGKHRLGHNPATHTKEVSQEDFENVRASGKRRERADGLNLFERSGGDRAALAKL